MPLGPADFAERVRRAPPTSVTSIATGRSGASLAKWKDGLQAVVKTDHEVMPDGKTTQREIPVSSHPCREVAFYRLAKVFGCDDIVPETVLFDFCGRKASAQAFVKSKHLDAFDKGLKDKKGDEWIQALCRASRFVPKIEWLKLVLLDFVAGARDRHSNNVGVIGSPKTAWVGSCQLVAFDNAVSFGETFALYHEVFHKWLFRESIRLDPFWDRFSSVSKKAFEKALYGLISPEEERHAWIRYRYAVEFPYRLPWKKISDGTDAPKEFPPYEGLFRDESREPHLYVAVA